MELHLLFFILSTIFTVIFSIAILVLVYSYTAFKYRGYPKSDYFSMYVISGFVSFISLILSVVFGVCIGVI